MSAKIKKRISQRIEVTNVKQQKNLSTKIKPLYELNFTNKKAGTLVLNN